MKNKFLIFSIIASLFSSCQKHYGEVPNWANFFNQKEYNYFIDLIEKYFKEKNCKISIKDGVLIFARNDYGFNNLGLLNIAQNCKQENQDLWETLIKDHFETMIKAAKFETEFSKIISDFDKVKKYLGVKLYHLEYIEAVGKENTIYKSITDDIVELLIFDLPNSVINVKPDNIMNWNKSIDELFDYGFNNIKSNYQIEASEEDFNESRIWFIQSNNLFTSNIILDKVELKKYLGLKGALLGLPHRHTVLIFPINDLGVVKAINTLIIVTNGMYKEGPGSLTDKIYWYNGNQFINLKYKYENKEIQFFPPDDFLNMMNELK